jgi:hypothetical protein
LLGHERDATEEQQPGRNRVAQRMEGVARHLQRLNMAPFN